MSWQMRTKQYSRLNLLRKPLQLLGSHAWLLKGLAAIARTRPLIYEQLCLLADIFESKTAVIRNEMIVLVV